MGLTGFDIYLVSPELSLVVIAMGAILFGRVMGRTLLVPYAVLGLVIPTVLALVLWNGVGPSAGGVELAFNGALIVDRFAVFLKVLLLGVLGLLVLAAKDYIIRYDRLRSEFVGLIMLSTVGLMLLGSAADLLTIYVSLELASLPIVALAAFSRPRVRAIEAGLKYLILSGISSAILLYGFTFIYGATGTLRLIPVGSLQPSIAQMITVVQPDLPFGSFGLLIGVTLVTAGFGFKLSMVPFHMWTPDVYEGAPTPVTSFLAVASKAAAFAVVMRLFYVAFAPVGVDWTLLFATLATITMTIGNLLAIVQSNIKRLLAYSSISHAGYILIGIAALPGGIDIDGSLGPESILFYLVAYAVTNLSAFFAVIVIVYRTGDERITSLTGIGRSSPLIGLSLALALISLIGIPPTVGFVGKLFLFNAAVTADLAWLAVVGAVNSVVSAYYYFNIIRLMYIKIAEKPRVVSPGISSGLALAVVGAGVVILGLWPNGLLEVAQSAASSLAY
jgi:NADH-quinone oxidoreductase subunit N